MPVSMTALSDDLSAETADLRRLLAGLDEQDWQRDTPAQGWTIADQMSHLAYFDDLAVLSATDADEFAIQRARLDVPGGVNPDRIAQHYRHLPGAEMLRWFDRSRANLIRTFADLEPSARVPWFGPDMSAASSLTARIMETWAHGQDVADTLGIRRMPTARLRHVAHIGVGACAYSFRVNDRQLPGAPIRVILRAPDGTEWAWGPSDADNRVAGDALDFCLAVTQRRHLDDLSLAVTGPVACEWMTIAQAYAGAAGTGRRPGTATV